MTTKRCVGLGVGGAMLWSACAVEVPGGEAGEAVDERRDALSAAMCGRRWVTVNGQPTTVYSEPDHRQYRKYEIEASLPGALLAETGRLQPELDLAITNGKVALTSAAKARCAARGKTGCPETDTLLGFQDGAAGLRRIDGLRDLLIADYGRFLATAPQAQTGCTSGGQHLDVGSVDDGTITRIPPSHYASYGVSSAGPCSVYPGVSPADSVMHWYKSSRNPGKLWCKMMAFGGPTTPTGNSSNHYVAYEFVANGTTVLEGWDPAPSTPVAVTGSTAATPSGNVAHYIYNGAVHFGSPGYVNSQAPNTVHTWSDTSQAHFVRMLGLGCYVNGQAGTYQPHALYPDLILTCR